MKMYAKSLVVCCALLSCCVVRGVNTAQGTGSAEKTALVVATRVVIRQNACMADAFGADGTLLASASPCKNIVTRSRIIGPNAQLFRVQMAQQGVDISQLTNDDIEVTDTVMEHKVIAEKAAVKWACAIS